MAKLDLDWLNVFVEVYRTQSVTRAAERLALPQSNASVALNNLRRYYGDRLFSRTARGMEPTALAQAIYPEVQEVVARLGRLSGGRVMFEPATVQRAFRISMTDISEIVVLPPLVNHLRRHAPGVQIESERSNAETARRLEAGEADLAIGFLPHLESGFYQQLLFKQDFVVLAGARHPRIKGALTRQSFLAEGHISVTTSGTGHAIVDKVLARQKMDRRIALRVPSFLGVARLVATTELLAIVPRKLGESLPASEGIRMLEPPVALPPFAVKQHWHERFHADAGNAWLRATLAQLMKQETARS